MENVNVETEKKMKENAKIDIIEAVRHRSLTERHLT
jgi:hypothetical protein